MFSIAHRFRSPSLFRRSISCLLLLIMLVAITGLPGVVHRTKPTGRSPENHERFPCENCPCGCSSAEYCWDKCCCLNDEGKLQWARRHQVQPPEFLIRRVAAQRASRMRIARSTVPQPSAADSQQRLETNGSAKSELAFLESSRTKTGCGCCCASGNASKKRSCDTRPEPKQLASNPQTGNSSPNQPLPDVKKSKQVVLGWIAAKCRGFESLWVMLGSVLIENVPQIHTPPIVLFRLGNVNEVVCSRDLCPDPPVPWSVG